MKIEDIARLQEMTPAAKPKAREAQESNFAGCLQEAQEKKPGTAAQVAEAGLPPLAKVEMAAAVGEPAASIKMLEAGLQKLEEFQQGLASAEVSLKSLEPLAAALGEDGSRLGDMAQKLPGDSPLKGIMEEAATVAKVASLKFARGDFV